MATCFACLQNGLLYILIPIIGSLLLGFNGLWAGFVLAPVLTLITAFSFVYLKYGKSNFQFLLKDIESEIIVLDDILTSENAAKLSQQVSDILIKHQYSKDMITHAALFVEEMGLTILDKNRDKKKDILVELSLFFEKDSLVIIERDSGILFDITDPD